MTVVGACNSGKTSLISQYTKGKLPVETSPSQAAEDSKAQVDLQAHNKKIGFHIVDIPGKADLMPLNRMYYRDTHAAIVLYDVTNAKTLEEAENWIEELKEGGPTEIIIMLAGNKMETPREKHQVDLNDAQ